MKKKKDVKELIKEWRIVPHAETHERILSNILEAYTETKQTKTVSIQLNIGRIIKIASISCIFLFSLLFLVTTLKKQPYAERDTSAEYILMNNRHTITQTDTSPHYILVNAQNNNLNLKEIKPCDILPLLIK